jgi:transketolase C-terminal domain/subunit
MPDLDSEVVYTPTRNGVTFEVEYYDDYWQNAAGTKGSATWTFDGKDVTIKSEYHAVEPAMAIADLLAYNGYEARVVKYVNAENKEDY